MERILHSDITDREGLGAALLGFDPSKADRRISISDLARIDVPPRGAAVGSWSTVRNDVLPDILIVRDEDKDDTLAWVSSFLNNLTPVSQSTRLVSISEVIKISHSAAEPTLGKHLVPWIGAIIAECNVQANTNINLKELSGTAAQTSATFAAARSVAIWKEDPQFKEVSSRHETLSQRLREGARPLSAQQLRPLWNTLARLNSEPDSLAFGPIRHLMDQAIVSSDVTSETLADITRPVARDLDLPELVGCASGTQAQRVQQLDRLAEKLRVGPSSAAIEAILGFGASLIDPGASVLPELLRKHADRMPMAAVWLGAFAGAWAPFRVMTDFNGLGRLLSKELLAPSDLFSKPRADVAYDEVIRWLGGAGPNKIPVRGMTARSVTVEIILGVSAPIPMGRVEAPRAEAVAPSTPQQEQLFKSSEAPRSRFDRAVSSRVIAQYFDLVDSLGKRVLALEDALREVAGIPSADPEKEARKVTGRAKKPDKR